ncbi:hypothetical protein ABZ154_25715 [Streptomyces sp. NPDC006261]|uniref:hypothetical protein n=1 Tax=Streptomyces sp. NPDC006261 TaxID=3156739 RepID=UPI0033B17C80
MKITFLLTTADAVGGTERAVFNQASEPDERVRVDYLVDLTGGDAQGENPRPWSTEPVVADREAHGKARRNGLKAAYATMVLGDRTAAWTSGTWQTADGGLAEVYSLAAAPWVTLFFLNIRQHGTPEGPSPRPGRSRPPPPGQTENDETSGSSCGAPEFRLKSPVRTAGRSSPRTNSRTVATSSRTRGSSPGRSRRGQ